jgi:hypothetical protein
VLNANSALWTTSTSLSFFSLEPTMYFALNLIKLVSLESSETLPERWQGFNVNFWSWVIHDIAQKSNLTLQFQMQRFLMLPRAFLPGLIEQMLLSCPRSSSQSHSSVTICHNSSLLKYFEFTLKLGRNGSSALMLRHRSCVAARKSSSTSPLGLSCSSKRIVICCS